MKTDFEARPVFLQNETRIKAHFLTCFLGLVIYRYLEKSLGGDFTCDEILNTLRNMNFASVQEQGFIPVYQRTKLTDRLHDVCGFHTDYEFIQYFVVNVDIVDSDVNKWYNKTRRQI
ncbi:MAG: hypothetical protein IJ062_00480 [Firmicutes bacterium]|nr:hypothetical protein [Bacillota bacterium]